MSDALVLVFLIPFLGGAAGCVLPGRAQVVTGLVTTVLTVAAVAVLIARLESQGFQHHRVGGWAAPLGISVPADGLSGLMLGLTGVVGLFVSGYAVFYFERRQNEPGFTRLFWPLWLLLWGGLNGLFVSGDVFNLYLLLEFTLVAAVALAVLGGAKAGHVSALRYLLTATTAGLFYLIGVTLLYAETGTLDLRQLAGTTPRGYLPQLALALMTGALALKCALFPLHFWLPAAHSTAPAPVSAVLSALVVKAGFYVIIRLWFEALPGMYPGEAAQLLAGVGAVAILWGSWRALRQDRLKMLVAYSTVSQIGYLFLLFPLGEAHPRIAIGAMTYHMLSHGLAKAAMFLGAGAVLKAAHSDDLEHTRGLARRAPLAIAALVLSGAALAGVLPGGGAKGKFVRLTLEHGQWWWAAVVVLGMMLAAAYTFAAVWRTFRPAEEALPEQGNFTPRLLGLIALVLAVVAIGFSFVSTEALGILEVTPE